MDASLIYDNLTTINSKHNHDLGLSNPLTHRHTLTLSSPDLHHRLEIRAQFLPTDAVAPPPVKPSTIPKTHTSKRRRIKRKRKLDSNGADDGGNDGGLFGGGDGPFGGNGNGNSNGNGNGGGGFNEFNWDESSPYPSDPAFDFVYEALTWFVLSNCLHFAFKRVVRIFVDGSADSGERRFR